MISTSCSWGWLRLYAAEDGLRLLITGVHQQQHMKSAPRQGLNQCCVFFAIMEKSTVPSLCSELALLALLVASTMAAVMLQRHLSSQFIDLWLFKLQKLCLASPLGPSQCAVDAQVIFRVLVEVLWWVTGWVQPSRLPAQSHVIRSLQTIPSPVVWLLPAPQVFSAESPDSRVWTEPSMGCPALSTQNLPSKWMFINH